MSIPGFYVFHTPLFTTILQSAKKNEELIERTRIHSLGRSLSRSLGRKLLLVFPLTNAQLDEEKNVVQWFDKCET